MERFQWNRVVLILNLLFSWLTKELDKQYVKSAANLGINWDTGIWNHNSRAFYIIWEILQVLSLLVVYFSFHHSTFFLNIRGAAFWFPVWRVFVTFKPFWEERNAYVGIQNQQECGHFLSCSPYNNLLCFRKPVIANFNFL